MPIIYRRLPTTSRWARSRLRPCAIALLRHARSHHPPRDESPTTPRRCDLATDSPQASPSEWSPIDNSHPDLSPEANTRAPGGSHRWYQYRCTAPMARRICGARPGCASRRYCARVNRRGQTPNARPGLEPVWAAGPAPNHRPDPPRAPPRSPPPGH